MAQKISQMTEQTTASMTEAGTSDFLGGYTATGGNANRKFSLSGLANYFLNKFKMTLGGSSQTVKSAIDALNSKMGFCRVQLIKGKTSYIANVVDDSGYNNPYGILIIAYNELYIASSVNTNAPLSSLTRLTTHTTPSSGLTLNDGVLQFGTDANRQYLCIMPYNVQLVAAT